MIRSEEAARTLALMGVSMREAGHGIVRGMYRWAMALHSSVEVEVGPGLSMLLCHGCWPTSRTPWPCDRYEQAERGLAAQEAEWERQDSERVAS